MHISEKQYLSCLHGMIAETEEDGPDRLRITNDVMLDASTLLECLSIESWIYLDQLPPTDIILEAKDALFKSACLSRLLVISLVELLKEDDE